jgi:hypothetical protein
MSYTQNIVRLPKNGVVGTATGTTLIGTTIDGTMSFFPVFAVVKVAAANTILGVGTYSIGTNAVSYNNVIPATALTGLSTLNAYTKFDVTGAIGAILPNTDIYLNITVAYTATGATLEVNLFGYYA